MESKKNRQDEDLAGKYKEFTSQYFNESTKIWEKYVKILSGMSKGKFKDPKFQQRVADFSKNEAGEFMRNLMQLNLNYYSVLMNMSADFTNRVFESVFQSSPDAKAQPTEAPAPPPTKSAIELSGRQGDVLMASFVIENKKQSPADISFEVSKLSTNGKTPAIKPQAEFEPASFVLQPGEERTIHFRLKLTEKYKANSIYRGEVGVKGIPGMEMDLNVSVLPKTQQKPAGKKPTQKPAAKKTTQKRSSKTPKNKGKKA